jgi:hypothetical protein
MGRVVDAAVNTIHVSLSTGCEVGLDLLEGSPGIVGWEQVGWAQVLRTRSPQLASNSTV